MQRLARLGIFLAVWEAIGRWQLIGSGALPPPSAILVQFWADRAVYPAHVWATFWPAGIGFLIGDAAAILLAIAFVLVPVLERLLRGFNIAIFAIPPITLSPLLVVAFQGTTPQIVLAAVTVYFPTMIATLIGLREIDPRFADIIRAYGGGTFTILWRVRLRAALPSIMTGLRIAAPSAVLGAILAEFGSGSRWGLGSFLLGSMGQANPARLWGIGLCATALAACGYLVFSLLGALAAPGTAATTMAIRRDPAAEGGKTQGPLVVRLALMLASFLMPFLLWQGVLDLLQISPVIARGPLGVWRVLVTGFDAADERAALVAALEQSVPVSILGMAIGIGGAFVLALVTVVRPAVGRALMPPSLLLQTMPLVALTPLVVLVLGRGLTATLTIVFAVTFFPAFLVMAQGMANTPRAARDVIQVYGGGALQQIWLVGLPSSIP